MYFYVLLCTFIIACLRWRFSQQLQRADGGAWREGRAQERGSATARICHVVVWHTSAYIGIYWHILAFIRINWYVERADARQWRAF